MNDDEPTQLTSKDINDFMKKLENGDFDIKMHACWECSKEFLPNYDSMKCDECFFSQFPKDQVKAFYRSFF